MGKLFGTDGVRGIANSELTPELAFKLGEAAGHFLGERGAGGESWWAWIRAVSGDLLEARSWRASALRARCALRAGIVPTPAVAFLARELGADGGVVISASHNPAEYNGIKFFDRDGFKLPDEIEDEIEEFLDRRASTGSGRPGR